MKSENQRSEGLSSSAGAGYWEERYEREQTGWDLGTVSPPIYSFFEKQTNKKARILIPGCGNSYEAQALAKLGYENITVIDISKTLTEKLRRSFKSEYPDIEVLTGDFFEHSGSYDIIIEQTFFCAIHPSMRTGYVEKCAELLTHQGQVIGLLFDREFVEGPPFGGSKNEYLTYFKAYFEIQHMDKCYNSISARAGSELFISLTKR
ncbi:methyltransferase domain-containing protein [Pedobacter suwonensis]|uniref:methyltransferase domain-containing protein n=1 Tax=Pedobacter suwonensis TaxID=332999 RepID=UPI0036A8724B